MKKALATCNKRDRRAGVFLDQDIFKSENHENKSEYLESDRSNDKLSKDLQEDIRQINLSGEAAMIKRRISILLKGGSHSDEDFKDSGIIKSERISDQSNQEFCSSLDSDKYGEDYCSTKIQEAIHRRRRSRKKCKAMFMPNIQIQGEEIKEEPDYESEDDHSEDEYEQDEEEDEADSPGYDYLEPIMEMQSSEERGSYSCILLRAPSLDYYDAHIYELKELSSSKALINRVPYVFTKNTSKALKYKSLRPKRKSKSASEIPKFNTKKASVIKKNKLLKR
ncbi:unnamed protein product [Moneuplotes crassus]|uniref:Uncharacterized protein n=1 Tax=Euplotes crassus TaxID=5936 RepID=A0AAD1UCP0_EUPCR|nr:unnamed protein product [Moneuplotes crassus]